MHLDGNLNGRKKPLPDEPEPKQLSLDACSLRAVGLEDQRRRIKARFPLTALSANTARVFARQGNCRPPDCRSIATASELPFLAEFYSLGTFPGQSILVHF
jgi:hypothetical protein